MAFRFFRRIKIAPGLSFNLSKSGASVSLGPRGTKLTLGGSSGKRATVGLPGTGLYYTTKLNKKSGSGQSGKVSSPATEDDQEEDVRIGSAARLNLGFFDELFTPGIEKSFVRGLQHLLKREEGEALKDFIKASALSDGAFMSGMLAMKMDDVEKAQEYLTKALGYGKEIGKYFKKYKTAMLLSMKISEETTVYVEPGTTALQLALVEVYQYKKEYDKAIGLLEKLMKKEAANPIVMLSYCELLFESGADNKKNLKKIVKLSSDIENESAVHAAVMLYKGKALMALELLTAARDTFTSAIRKKKDRSDELINSLRYERALCYEAMGQKSRARKEFEKLYADDPDFEDTAQRLGL